MGRARPPATRGRSGLEARYVRPIRFLQQLTLPNSECALILNPHPCYGCIQYGCILHARAQWHSDARTALVREAPKAQKTTIDGRNMIGATVILTSSSA